MQWLNLQTPQSRSFTCGYCGHRVASNKGYQTSQDTETILVCPHCEQPTYFRGKDLQVPGVSPGNTVASLPSDIEALYSEARNCVAAGSHTGAVLLCRKLLMSIAVAQGASPGKSFLEYVDHLAANGYVPPNGRGWVDHIRKKGNEANHEIALMSKTDAEELVSFSEMLLKFIYEFPSKVPSSSSSSVSS